MHKPRILIVEDEPAIRGLIDDFLASEGFETIVARDGCEAIDAAIRERPDIVLMDMMLPVLNGGVAIGMLRDDARTRGMRVIAMSADARALKEALSLDVDGVLAKPFNLNDLLSVIAAQTVGAGDSRRG